MVDLLIRMKSKVTVADMQSDLGILYVMINEFRCPQSNLPDILSLEKFLQVRKEIVTSEIDHSLTNTVGTHNNMV